MIAATVNVLQINPPKVTLDVLFVLPIFVDSQRTKAEQYQ